MGGASLHLWTEPDGSTHYTVSLGAGGGSAHCSRYSHRTPIMSVWRSGVNVTFETEGDAQVTKAELQFARDLAATAAAYLAECERWHVPDDETGGAVDRVA